MSGPEDGFFIDFAGNGLANRRTEPIVLLHVRPEKEDPHTTGTLQSNAEAPTPQNVRP